MEISGIGNFRKFPGISEVCFTLPWPWEIQRQWEFQRRLQSGSAGLAAPRRAAPGWRKLAHGCHEGASSAELHPFDVHGPRVMVLVRYRRCLLSTRRGDADAPAVVANVAPMPSTSVECKEAFRTRFGAARRHVSQTRHPRRPLVPNRRPGAVGIGQVDMDWRFAKKCARTRPAADSSTGRARGRTSTPRGPSGADVDGRSASPPRRRRRRGAVAARRSRRWSYAADDEDDDGSSWTRRSRGAFSRVFFVPGG